MTGIVGHSWRPPLSPRNLIERLGRFPQRPGAVRSPRDVLAQGLERGQRRFPRQDGFKYGELAVRVGPFVWLEVARRADRGEFRRGARGLGFGQDGARVAWRGRWSPRTWSTSNWGGRCPRGRGGNKGLFWRRRPGCGAPRWELVHQSPFSRASTRRRFSRWARAARLDGDDHVWLPPAARGCLPAVRAALVSRAGPQPSKTEALSNIS